MTRQERKQREKIKQEVEELEKKTLETLKHNSFNKIRMCVFPKNYANNANEPELYPFEKKEDGTFDFEKFEPKFFRHLEECLRELMELGIEADLILFHPYDKGRWGFDRMSAEIDEFYLKYIISRIASFRNIWWSMANEYDYMREKTVEDWENKIEFVAKTDPYKHLLSIHNGDIIYKHWNEHLTHASIQFGTYNNYNIGAEFSAFRMLRDVYQKPVIYDEVGYEGNLVQRWGHLSARQVVDKFWKATVTGTYMTHGETFTDPEDIIWWAKGGNLKGQSPKRIAFLRQILEKSKQSLNPLDSWWVMNGAGRNGQYYLFYFGFNKINNWKFELPAFKIDEEIPIGTKFKVDIIDTWNMTINTVEEEFEVTEKDGYSFICNFNPMVEMPEKEMMAIRVRRLI